MSEKTFSFNPSSRLDKKLASFRATNSAEHAEFLKTICCNSATGYVVDKGSFVLVSSGAGEKVKEHLQKNGWIIA